MVWVGRDLKAHLAPIPPSWAGVIRLLVGDTSLSPSGGTDRRCGMGAGPSPSSLSSSFPALQCKLCSPVKQSPPLWWRGRLCIINAAGGIGVLQCPGLSWAPVQHSLHAAILCWAALRSKHCEPGLFSLSFKHKTSQHVKRQKAEWSREVH